TPCAVPVHVARKAAPAAWLPRRLATDDARARRSLGAAVRAQPSAVAAIAIATGLPGDQAATPLAGAGRAGWLRWAGPRPLPVYPMTAPIPVTGGAPAAVELGGAVGAPAVLAGARRQAYLRHLAVR